MRRYTIEKEITTTSRVSFSIDALNYDDAKELGQNLDLVAIKALDSFNEDELDEEIENCITGIEEE